MTGKNKIQFEEWYFLSDNDKLMDVDIFYLQCTPEMQIGVYTAYYRSKGLHLLVLPTDITEVSLNYGYYIEWLTNGVEKKISSNGALLTPEAAQTEALKQVNELMNEQLNKDNIPNITFSSKDF